MKCIELGEGYPMFGAYPYPDIQTDHFKSGYVTLYPDKKREGFSFVDAPPINPGVKYRLILEEISKEEKRK